MKRNNCILCWYLNLHRLNRTGFIHKAEKNKYSSQEQRAIFIITVAMQCNESNPIIILILFLTKSSAIISHSYCSLRVNCTPIPILVLITKARNQKTNPIEMIGVQCFGCRKIYYSLSDRFPICFIQTFHFYIQTANQHNMHIIISSR